MVALAALAVNKPVVEGAHVCDNHLMELVLVHGSGQKADSWSRTAALLEGEANVHCPQLSQLTEGGPASWFRLASGFESYMDQWEGKPILVGLSLGGMLALDYAARHGKRLAHLVLIGTPHRIPRLALGFQNLVFRALPKSTFDSMAFSKADTFALSRSMKDVDLEAAIAALSVPTTVVCGSKDRTNLDSARYIASHVEGARLIILEGVGHIVNEEAPQLLAPVIKDVLEEVGHMMAPTSYNGEAWASSPIPLPCHTCKTFIRLTADNRIAEAPRCDLCKRIRHCRKGPACGNRHDPIGAKKKSSESYYKFLAKALGDAVQRHD